MQVLLHSLVSAQKPEMPALSEIDLDFHSRAPDSRVECFPGAVLIGWSLTLQSSALENIAIPYNWGKV